MMDIESNISWVKINQAFLVAEFARLKQLLSGTVDEHHPEAELMQTNMDSPPAIDQLAGLFGLTKFERELLLLCAGVEMDSKLARQCGEAEGRPQRHCATFGLAMAVLPDPHWSALVPSRPLRRFHFLQVEAGHALTSAPLRIDERILHYLAGLNVIDARVDSALEASVFPEWITEAHRQIAAEIERVLASDSEPSPLLHLCGNDPHGQEDVAAIAAQRVGRQLFTMRSDDLPPAGPELDQFALLWQREALLLQGALLIQCESALSPSARRLAERLPGFVFLAGREPIRLNRALLRFDLNKPQPMEQKQLWEKALGRAAANLNGTLDTLSEQFWFSARTIFSVTALVCSKGDDQLADHLWKSCRSLARPRLETLAQRIVPSANWHDVVLPEPQTQVLHQLASQARQRLKVYEGWGFSAKGRRGLGITALFAGESGTGKTLAAEVIAHELDLDLYRIDLSAVVSKYIGETEKNLKQVFDAAEEGGAVLLFDEADALFGKRSDVRDSHDRYANIEVSYLLQRMEAYQGLAILTTNLKASLDKAFQRRLRFIVNFPFPDATHREAIWRKVFPEATPTHGLDHKKLAQLNVAGGNIRNIALNAAFLAAQAGTPVEMANLLEAAKLEAQKIERPLSDAEMRGWV